MRLREWACVKSDQLASDQTSKKQKQRCCRRWLLSLTPDL